MPKSDIIVIGTSAGGVEALQTVVSSLPSDLPAAIFVVLHISPRSESFLPRILSRAGMLPAVRPEDGERIQQGKIYVAPPDHHLVIEKEHVHLSMGPKEQHQRPCINVTFRSAAIAYGPRVAGAVLTGELDDGTAGLWEIKRRGGVAIVQHPEEAPFPSMPLSALRDVVVDHTLRLAQIGPLLTRLATTEKSPDKDSGAGNNEMPSTVTDLTCPDCRGSIWESRTGPFLEYRCRVGHVFSPKTMLAEQFAAQEKLLYSAAVALEEGAALAERLADKLGPDLSEKLKDEARERAQQAEAVHQILRHRTAFSLD
jgi:two-component system chemotaxis response regulator CheB